MEKRKRPARISWDGPSATAQKVQFDSPFQQVDETLHLVQVRLSKRNLRQLSLHEQHFREKDLRSLCTHEIALREEQSALNQLPPRQ